MAMDRKDVERMVKLEEGLKANTKETRAVKDEVRAVKKEIQNLPDALTDKLIESFDARYAAKADVEAIQTDIHEIKETVDPITNIRKKLWVWIIGTVIGSSVLGAVIYNLIREYMKARGLL